MWDIELIRLLADFGLVVLIWIVQLILYPGFQYYSQKDLSVWHRIYTRRITFIVLPLMLIQLITACIQLREISTFTTTSIIGITLIWIITFAKAIPLHNKIASGDFTVQSIKTLILWNWPRTILWTALFIGSLFKWL